MSQTITEQTNSQIFVSTDTTKFLLGFNEFVTADVTASGADVDLVEGMVMGKISATAKIIPLDKDATDGSALPFGICIKTQTVVDGTTVSITCVNKGRIAESIINFLDVETLATPTGASNFQKTIRDHLNDLGLILESGVELTAIDNS